MFVYLFENNLNWIPSLLIKWKQLKRNRSFKNREYQLIYYSYIKFSLFIILSKYLFIAYAYYNSYIYLILYQLYLPYQCLIAFPANRKRHWIKVCSINIQKIFYLKKITLVKNIVLKKKSNLIYISDVDRHIFV